MDRFQISVMDVKKKLTLKPHKLSLLKHLLKERENKGIKKGGAKKRKGYKDEGRTKEGGELLLGN